MARVNGITTHPSATHSTILTLLRKHSPDGTTQTRRHTSDIAYYSVCRPLNDERLSWSSWLTYSGRLAHISGYPSAACRAWDRESSPVKDQRSNHCTTQPTKSRHSGHRILMKRRIAVLYPLARLRMDSSDLDLHSLSLANSATRGQKNMGPGWDLSTFLDPRIWDSSPKSKCIRCIYEPQCKQIQ